MIRLLIVNDDGIESKGLRALVDALGGAADIHIVAPTVERSGAAMAVTISKPVIVEERTYPGAASAFAVDGTPVDCVKVALNSLLPARPDMLLSGINHGSNLGINVHYSGTVAAAIEAASQGIAAIALSVPRHGPADFQFAARFAAQMLSRIAERPLPPGAILNVNFPVAGDGLPRGVKLTRQCPAGIAESYHVEKAEDGRRAFLLHGKVDCCGTGEHMDNSAVQAGYVSITPLSFDLTDSSAMRASETYRFGDLIPGRNE